MYVHVRIKVGSRGHAVGHNFEWEKEFPWLLPLQNDSGIVTAMLCRICKRHKTENKYNISRVWSDTPCRVLPRNFLRCQALNFLLRPLIPPHDPPPMCSPTPLDHCRASTPEKKPRIIKVMNFDNQTNDI